MFLSPHKFIGGPGTPGVLVVRRALLRNRVPTVPGGGTVAYVNPTEHRYLDDPVDREEGGTPAIVESIRAGLVFQLKEAVGADTIQALERSFIGRAIASWGANPNIELLGNLRAERLSIVSFVVRHGGRYLHHNFVVALLNDLFGIQSRGGCSCAGPYGHRLLGIDIERSHSFEREITRGCEGIKPGWVRVNFNYFISEVVFEYLLEAVHLVADQGWKLLGDYRFDPASGLWRHRRGPVEPPLRLRAVGYDARGGSVPLPCTPPPPTPPSPATWIRPAACWRPAPPRRHRRRRSAPRPVGGLRGAALVRAPPGVPVVEASGREGPRRVGSDTGYPRRGSPAERPGRRRASALTAGRRRRPQRSARAELGSSTPGPLTPGRALESSACHGHELDPPATASLGTGGSGTTTSGRRARPASRTQVDRCQHGRPSGRRRPSGTTGPRAAPGPRPARRRRSPSGHAAASGCGPRRRCMSTVGRPAVAALRGDGEQAAGRLPGGAHAAGVGRAARYRSSTSWTVVASSGALSSR